MQTKMKLPFEGQFADRLCKAGKEENVQARQLQGFLDCQSGIEPTKRTIAKMESSREYSGKMNDPEWDRNAEGPGTIRARG